MGMTRLFFVSLLFAGFLATAAAPTSGATA